MQPKKCNLTQVLTVSIETARHYLKCAWTNYKIHKKSAPRLQIEFLHDQEDKARNPAAKKAISMIRKHEETRSSWRTINRCHGKTRNKGISCVETKVNGKWQKLTARDEVEAAIMANNTERFHLTRSTPLMSQHMSTRLGYLAEHEVSKSIINNEFVPDPLLDEYTNKFLSFISNRTQLPAITADVMKEDFIYFWKGARERTSSSLSNRHFGHYKAASNSPMLSELHASFQHIVSHTGICLIRWAKGLTVMLEKLAGVIRVNKLRALLLMEADFNSVNKLIFGHRMIKQAEKHKRLPEELYSSRSSLNAILVAINRRFVIDIFKQKRRSGAIAGVDAAQCYDRIVHSLSMLVSQREGAPLSSLMMMFGVIQSMFFYYQNYFRRLLLFI